MMLTSKQNAVADKVRSILKDETWFRGIALDNFPSDDEIDADFDGCVSQVICETAYWDDPAVTRTSKGIRTFEVQPCLSEVAAGFEVFLYEDGELVDTQFRRDKDLAEDIGNDWVKP